ncbi:MAG: hypothetical protein N4A61_15640 [Pelagimonas sp.]|jgi:hypothetical protein|nr:hypothetical protein [Pelagimonas sp.]
MVQKTQKPKTVWLKTLFEVLLALAFAMGAFIAGSQPMFLLGVMLAFVIVPARGVRLWLQSYAQTDKGTDGSKD